MRHICATITICTAASVGLGLAQDIPTDTSKARAYEWKTPATTKYCLAAFRLYATYTANEGEHPLSVEYVETAALKALLKGIPGANEAPAKDLLATAQGLPGFLDWLAEANTLTPTPPADPREALLKEAMKRIDWIYDNVPEGKQHLSAVREVIQNRHLALFRLLDAYPKPAENASEADAKAYADGLEFLRAAYQAESSELFALVSNKIVPQQKTP